MRAHTVIAVILLSRLLAAGAASAEESGIGREAGEPLYAAAPMRQTEDQAAAKSRGCMSCHTTTDSLTMHSSPGVILGCTDCHGGNASVFARPGTPASAPEYRQALEAAH